MENTNGRFSNKLVYINYMLSVLIVITHTYCTDFANVFTSDNSGRGGDD